MVCDSHLSPYFTKDFTGTFGGECGLERVDYWRCSACGLAIAKTIHDMSRAEWERLNWRYHSSYQGADSNPDDPRWLKRLDAQASNITLLAREGLLSRRLPWIDYGCGDGKLADVLTQNGLKTWKFDRYLAREEGYLKEEDLKQQYSLVINSSVFEHIRDIRTLDEIAGLVDESGVFALHVLVRESIPCDPSWFYLLPVHCTFFTNNSMQILFDRWRFNVSMYHVPSTTWFWFRNEPPEVQDFVQRKSKEAPGDYHFKIGFMDYWK